MNYQSYPYYNQVSAPRPYQQMDSPYPQFNQPQYQPQQVQQPMIKGRLVSNLEEANAAMIDFDGSVFVFLDKTHNKVYTKQLGLDGNIAFQQYSLDVPVSKESSSIDLSDYVTIDMLDKKLSDIRDLLDKIETKPVTVKGGSKA